MRHCLCALALTAIGTTDAFAMDCGERDHVIASLSKNYSERHIASGYQSSAGLMEVWASETDGTWTILMTRPDGRTCIVASGTHWLESEMVPVGGEPA